MTKEMITTIDKNNSKALNVVNMAITAMENGFDKETFDAVSLLEVIRDYLKANDRIFDQTA